MVVIHIIGFISVLYYLLRRWNRSPFELIPVLYSIVLLILYSLAFFIAMHWIDGIMFVCGCTAFISLRLKTKNVCFNSNDKYSFLL